MYAFFVALLLEIESLTKSFGGLVAVKNVDMLVDEGEILGLIGPNGAGKSTIFNLVTGVYRPDRGEVKFKGKNIVGLKPYEICKRGIARTFQIVKPFGNISVFQNVLVGAMYGTAKKRKAEDTKLRTERAIKIVGLSVKKDVLAKNLIVADQRRLEIARALATEPELLLLDEVMAGLNLHEAEQCLDLVRKIRDSGVTVVMIDHVIKAVMNISNRIIVLNHGEKIADGSPQDVIDDASVISAYLGEKGAKRI